MRIKIVFIILIFSLFACDQKPKEERSKSIAPAKEEQKLERPTFSSDSAYSYIEQQVAFGPRVPNTEAHRKTAAYLSKKLEDFGFNVSNQKADIKAFNGKTLHIINIIGEYKPELNNRIMLFAHWDTRPFADQDTEDRNKPIDGANDGASGVGVLLEVARQIQAAQANIGVDIFFFDAEDHGQPSDDMRKRQSNTWCLGSQYWAANPHKENYTANFGILLDMVGAPNALFTKESISMYHAPHIVDLVWNYASRLGHGKYFSRRNTTFVGEDDHLYINKIAKIPSIDIIQYDPSTGAFGPYWHTHDDNLSVISKETLQAVGETVLVTVLEEAK